MGCLAITYVCQWALRRWTKWQVASIWIFHVQINGAPLFTFYNIISSRPSLFSRRLGRTSFFGKSTIKQFCLGSSCCHPSHIKSKYNFSCLWCSTHFWNVWLSCNCLFIILPLHLKAWWVHMRTLNIRILDWHLYLIQSFTSKILKWVLKFLKEILNTSNCSCSLVWMPCTFETL